MSQKKPTDSFFLFKKDTYRKMYSWAKKNSVALFFIASLLVPVIFYYDVVFEGKTLLSPGLTAGVMGDNGPYGYVPKVKNPGPEYAAFLKDLGSNAWAGEPEVDKIAQIIRQGAFPLWNDNVQMGKPLAANFISTAFFPLKLILYILPTMAGWDIYLLARFSVGIFFTFLFLRQIGVRQFPAFIAGIAFSFSGYFVLFPNIQNVDTDILVPMMFWAIAYTISLTRRDSIRPYQYFFAIAGVVTVMLSNIPETLILIILAGAIYWIYLWYVIYRKNGTEAFQRSFKVSLQVIIPSALIVLPLYLINMEFVQNAFTLHTPEAALGTKAWLHTSYMVAHVLPYIQSPFFLKPEIPVWADTANYMGIVGFFLMTVGACAAIKQRGTKLFLLIFGLIVFAKIYGHPVWFNNWFGSLPGFNLVLYIKYAQPLLSFAVATMIGFGLHGLWTRETKRIEYLIASSAFGGLLIWGIYHIPNFTLSALNAKVISLISVSLIAIGWVLVLNRLNRYRAVVIGFLGLTLVLELFMVMTPRHARPERYDSFTEAPFVSYLQTKEKPYRIFAYERLLYPEITSAFDIDDVRDLDALFIDEYVEYIRNFVSPDMYDRFTGASEGSSELSPAHTVNNKFLDILNVKYIAAKTPPIDFFPQSDVIQKFVAANPPTPGFRELGFNVNNELKRALLVHPPTSVCAPLAVTEEKPFLLFDIGMDKASLKHKPGDGAGFIVKVNDSEVFSKFLNPKANPEQNRWSQEAVDLSKYAGTEPTICLQTTPGGNSGADIAGWADMRFGETKESMPPIKESQYTLIYNGADAVVFENTHAKGRGFLVGSVAAKPTTDEVIAGMKSTDFDPYTEAVILDEKDKAALPEFDQEACTTTPTEITDYTRPNPNRVSFTVKSPGSCFLVWSDSYYPGWVAKVDGKKQSIYHTNLLLRGLPLSEGTHTIEFIYRPWTFYGGLVGTFIGVILAIYWGMQLKQSPRKKK